MGFSFNQKLPYPEEETAPIQRKHPRPSPWSTFFQKRSTGDFFPMITPF